MRRMAGPPAVAAKVQIPRWIQLVGLPLVLLFLWTVAGAARHVIFLFLVAALIAFLLNPIVRGLTRVWIPRGFGVAIVYVTFAAIVILAGAALGTVVVNQTKSSASRVNDYFTVEHGQDHRTHAYTDVDKLQVWLDNHHLSSLKVRKQGHDLVDKIRRKDVSKYTGKVINFVEGAAIGTVKFLFSLVLVIVVSVYMLLGMPRLAKSIEQWADVSLGSNHLPWLQGEDLRRLRRMLEYFLLNNQIRQTTANMPWTQNGIRRALGAPLRWRLRNNQYAFPWELWVARATERLVTRRSLLTGQTLGRGMQEVC